MSICIVLVSAACAHDSIEKINLQNNNYKDFNLKVIKAIPLETKDVSLISSITKIIYSDNRFYIYDFQLNSISCFSDLSKFLFRIQTGRGPGELIEPSDFIVGNRTLLVLDQDKLKKYDLNGNFIHESRFIKQLYFYKFNFDQDSNLLVFGNSPSINDLKKIEGDPLNNRKNIISQLPISRYRLIDKTLIKEIGSFIPLSFNLRSFVCHDPMDVYDDHTLCLSPPTNYIYEYKNRNIKIEYKIDFGKNGFTEKDIKKGDEFLRNQVREGKKFGYIDYINETKELISFSYVKRVGYRSFALYSKITHKVADYSDLLSKSGLPEGDLLATAGDDFLCVIYPSKITIDERNRINQDLNLLSPINENSNPIILMIQIIEENYQ